MLRVIDESLTVHPRNRRPDKVLLSKGEIISTEMIAVKGKSHTIVWHGDLPLDLSLEELKEVELGSHLKSVSDLPF